MDLRVLLFLVFYFFTGVFMSPIVYALFTYALTAALSFLVIGVIVLINKIMNKTNEGEV